MEKQTQPASIYKLIDPRDSLPFYVGSTDNMARRFQQHLACNGSNLMLNKRIAKLLAQGLKPLIEEIEPVTRADMPQREVYWIRQLLAEGMPLLNVSNTAPEDYVKGTYSITPEHDLMLERIRLARRAKGQRVDKSALVCEAIDLLRKSEQMEK